MVSVLKTTRRLIIVCLHYNAFTQYVTMVTRETHFNVRDLFTVRTFHFFASWVVGHIHLSWLLTAWFKGTAATKAVIYKVNHIKITTTTTTTTIIIIIIINVPVVSRLMPEVSMDSLVDHSPLSTSFRCHPAGKYAVSFTSTFKFEWEPTVMFNF